MSGKFVIAAMVAALVVGGANGQARGTKPAQGQAAPLNENLNTPLPLASDTAKQPVDSQLDSTNVPDPTDRSQESSPLPPVRPGVSLPMGSSISVAMTRAVDSGSVRNGDMVRAVLAAPVRTSSGMMLAKGTPVAGTVVSSAKAGMVQSGGILSLQLTQVGPVHVVTDVADFNGQEGHKDVADAAPDKGTEAKVDAGAVVQFHVLELGVVPGLVSGAPQVKDQTAGQPTNQTPGAQAPAGQANTAPGVNQRQVGGATQGVTPQGTGAGKPQ